MITYLVEDLTPVKDGLKGTARIAQAETGVVAVLWRTAGVQSRIFVYRFDHILKYKELILWQILVNLNHRVKSHLVLGL